MQQMISLGKQILWTTLALLILVVAVRIATFLMFPIGGAEYHAIFAYTLDGRLEPAIAAYLTYIVSLTLVAGLLIWRRYPVPWWILGGAATVVGLWTWWSIVSWQPQSGSFHRTVVLLTVLIPFILIPLTRAAVLLRERFPRGSSSQRAA